MLLHSRLSVAITLPQLCLKITPSGPIIDVVIGVSAPRSTALQKAGQPVPSGITARLLIDTGASHTVIDPTVLAPLNITPSGAIAAHTPSTSGIPCQMNQYDVSIIIPHPSISRHFPAIAVTEASLRPQGIDGLLGRDILATCLLIYSGTDGSFILST